MATRIGDVTLLRGIPLHSLIDAGRQVTIVRRRDLHEALFHVSLEGGGTAWFLVKTSTSPKRWQFTFTDEELRALRTGPAAVGAQPRYVTLVCKTDGVCCLSLEELEQLLEEAGDGSRFVGVSRPPGGSYWVSGPGGVLLGHSIRASDWPDRILGVR